MSVSGTVPHTLEAKGIVLHFHEAGTCSGGEPFNYDKYGAEAVTNLNLNLTEVIKVFLIV